MRVYLDQAAVGIVAIAVPLLVGFAAWMLKLGGRVAMLERDQAELKTDLASLQRNADGIRDAVARIETSLAVVANSFDELVKRLDRERS